MAIHETQAIDSGPPEDDMIVPGRMTEEEFVAWCDEDNRAEWVDGEVIMPSPANIEHAGLNGWLTTLLTIYSEQNDLGRVLTDVQVRFEAQRRRRVPDIWFVAKSHLHRIQETHLEGPPDLAVEIVSPDSEARDWRDKYLEYETAGVEEYWVIDPASQHMEAYVLATSGPEGGTAAARAYRRLPEQQGVIISKVLPGLRLPVAWLWPQTRPKLLDAVQRLLRP